MLIRGEQKLQNLSLVVPGGHSTYAHKHSRRCPIKSDIRGSDDDDLTANRSRGVVLMSVYMSTVSYRDPQG